MHFCGILLTSSAYFLIYCAYMRNMPRIYPRAILPAFVSGVMWALADVSWFIANAVLSEAVSFPMVTSVRSYWLMFISAISFSILQSLSAYLLLSLFSVLYCISLSCYLCSRSSLLHLFFIINIYILIFIHVFRAQQLLQRFGAFSSRK